MKRLNKITLNVLPYHWQEYLRVQRVRKEFDWYRFNDPQYNLLKAFDEHQALFIHIPKTAGISVRESLFQTSGFGKHVKAITYKYYLGNIQFKRYFKFTFVRNPWSRALSAYFFLQGGGINEWDRQWSERVLSKYPNFEQFVMEWLSEKNSFTWLHFIPQYYWVCDHKNRNQMDFTGRMETLEQDYDIIRAKTGIGGPMVYKNKGAGIVDYRDYYSDVMQKKVGEVYKTDIEMFGYNF